MLLGWKKPSIVYNKGVHCMKEYRVLSPTAILGYGFPEASFEAGLRLDPHVIAVDAGSTDPGPYYLGSGKSFTDAAAVKRDLSYMLTAAIKHKIPLIIGTAGGSGANSHLYWNVDIICELAKELGLDFKLAIIESELSCELVLQNYEKGKLKELYPAPKPIIEDIKSSVNIVAQMGHEPFIKALEQDAQVIISGRAYDPVMFAALAIKHEFDTGLALHMGKILECAAIAATPGSGSDCMIGYLRGDHFELEALNPMRICTTTSIAAHTLYEKSNPTKLPGPGGVLDLTHTTFKQHNNNVIVHGTQFIPDSTYFVKLEAAKKLGYRTISFASTTDPIFIENLEGILEDVKTKISNNFNNIKDFFLDFHIYGEKAAGLFDIKSASSFENKHNKTLEIAVLIEAVAKTQALADTICSFARSTLLHFGYNNRKSTAGNLAFPFSPSDFKAGTVYEFSLYCLMQIENPSDFFPVKIYKCEKGELNDKII